MKLLQYTNQKLNYRFLLRKETKQLCNCNFEGIMLNNIIIYTKVRANLATPKQIEECAAYIYIYIYI